MKSLFLLIIIISNFLTQQLYTQSSSWQKINSPTTYNLKSLFFTSQSTVFAAGDYSIIKSTNSGVNWSVTNFPSSKINCIRFLNSNIGWACGSYGTILKTENEGLTWTSKNNSFNMSFNSIFPLSQNECWVVGEGGTVLLTTDGGNTWQQKSNFANVDYKIVFFRNNVGWIAGSGPKIYKTTNKGTTWNLFSMPYFVPYGISFTSDAEGFLVGGLGNYPNNSGYICKTNDFGNTWIIKHQSTDLWFSVEFITSQVGWVCGTNGKILKTTNSGSDWMTEPISTTSFLNDLCFVNDNLGFVVGDNGNIWKYSSSLLNDTTSISIAKVSAFKKDTVTIDVNIQLTANESVSSFQIDFSGFKEKLHFYKIDTAGTLIGKSKWLLQHNITDSVLFTAAAGSNNINTSGTLLRLKFIVPQNSALGFKPINFKNVLLNTGTNFIKLINGGVNVVVPKYGDVDLNNLVQAFDASMILKYIAGTIQLNSIQKVNADVTLDGTISAYDATIILKYLVHLIDSLPHPGNILASGQFNMPNISAAIGQSFKIPFSISNGSNIFSFENSFNFDNSILTFEGINLEQISNGYLTEYSLNDNFVNFSGASSDANLSNGIIAKLKFKINQNAQAGFTKVFLTSTRLNENDFQLNSAFSTITILTDIKNENQNPSDYLLEQNYPNPFSNKAGTNSNIGINSGGNPSTKIKYAIPFESRVKLVVYNTLGQVVEKLVDETKSAGVFELNFITKELNTGIYFYSIEATSIDNKNHFKDTKKLLLMK